MNSLLLSTQFLSCATCMADQGGVSQKAANFGIFIMLGALLLIFSFLAATAISFARRAKRVRLAGMNGQ
jgi:ABC-type multidrug transport system permease subunit